MKRLSRQIPKRHQVATVLICTGCLLGVPSSIEARSSVHGLESVQQKSNIKGVVKDSRGETIIGASIRVKGSQTGAVTDLDGNFTIDADPNSTLIVSYIGFVTQEIPLKGRTSLDITLSENVQSLDELVVVGYGTMRKKDLTGSVIQVKPDKIATEAPKSVADILRGTAGLKVGLSTSAKGGGSLEIRGQRSVSSTVSSNPLIILDGMPFYGELSEINPNDIGQIDVLKDASAAAVYGSQAANGVIIITTKKGKKGKPTINFRANFGFDTKAAYSTYFKPDEYMKYREDWYKTPTYGKNPETGKYEAYQARDKDGKLTVENGYYDRADRLPQGVSVDTWRQYSPVSLIEGESDKSLYARRLTLADNVLENYLAGRTFDWEDYAFRTGFNQDYNLSVSGAGDSMNYYLSMGYADNKGAVVGDDYSTVRANMKLTANVTKWLEVSANVNFQDRTNGNLSINVGSTVQNSPYASYKDENGSLVMKPMGGVSYPTLPGYNYDFERQYLDLESGYTVLNSIFTAKVKLPFNITYSFNASPRYQFYHYRYFSSAERPESNPIYRGVDRNQAKDFDWSLNNTINWDYTFAKVHHFNLTLVQEAEEFRHWADQINARNIQPSDALGFHNTANGGKLESSFTSNDTHQSALGFMARLFYSYDDRYMMTATFRRDGYSAFGSNNPYANFPSFGFSWAFTNEKFFKWKAMSTGKLRLSWGKNGNRSLSDPYISLANLRNGINQYGYLDASGNLKEMQYLLVERMASPDLKWEKSAALNFGLDFGFLNDRITGSLEAYVVKTQDMIMAKQLPNFTGFSSIATNLGEVQNTGFELTVNSHNIQRENFTWDTSFNFTYNNNKIKHLYYEYEDVLDDKGNIIGSKERDEYGTWFIGKPISEIWSYKVTGIWQADEADEAAKVGQVPGDPKVANLYTEDDKINEDGTRTPVYNDKDKTFLGQTTSPFFWQMRNSFTFLKDFEFSFNMYSYFGSKYLDTSYLNRDNTSNVITYGANLAKKEYWTPENPTNKYARLDAKGPTGAESPGILRNRSFIRLENITLSYTLPQSLLKRWNIQTAKVYGTVRNVGVISFEKYNYGDIETFGYLNRVFTLGLNLTF